MMRAWLRFLFRVWKKTVPRFVVECRVPQCYLTMCRYSTESGSCMTLPAGSRRSKGDCLPYNRQLIESSGDESTRSLDDAVAGSMG